jgi:hypothetical protein
MQLQEPVARLIIVNRHPWVVGGRWSEPTYQKKPRDLFTAARNGGMDPKRLSALFLQREQQIGWFIAADGDKPRRGTPLVWAVIRQLEQRRDVSLPLMAVFNLGPCWWMVILDAVGNVLPGWERWGTEAEIKGILANPDISGMLNPFRGNARFFETENESWEWLLAGLPKKRPQAMPANALRKAMTQTAIVVTVLGALGASADIGWHWYQHQQAEKAAASLRAKEMQDAMLRNQQALAAQNASGAIQARLEAYWKQYPRPWKTAPSWNAVLTACRPAFFGKETRDGWRRVRVTCGVVNGQLQIRTVWSRETLATVLKKPTGVLGINGNTVTENKTTFLYTGSGVTAALPAGGRTYLQWLGAVQSYAGVLTINLPATMTAFSPPVPSFVPKQDAAKVHSPVLWKSAALAMSGRLAPWDGWPGLDTTGFVPLSVTMNTAGNSVFWKLQGVQYARP